MKKLALLCLLLTTVALARPRTFEKSKFHRENIGTIVFSNKEIKFRNEAPERFLKSIVQGDAIFGRMYFATSMVETPLYHPKTGSELAPYVTRNGDWELLVKIDGVNQDIVDGVFAKGRVTEEMTKSWDTWQLNLQPDRKGLTEYAIITPWLKKIRRLDVGTHKIELEYRSVMGHYRSEPMAKGSFDLIVK